MSIVFIIMAFYAVYWIVTSVHSKKKRAQERQSSASVQRSVPTQQVPSSRNRNQPRNAGVQQQRANQRNVQARQPISQAQPYIGKSSFINKHPQHYTLIDGKRP